MFQKRSFVGSEDSTNAPSSKRVKYDEQLNLSDFSDCVLIHILKYLDTTSLYQLGRTCHHFKSLVTDPKFWKYVDARRSPNNTGKYEFVTNNINNCTKHLLLASDNRSHETIPLSLIAKDNFLKNITMLALENQFLNGREVKLRMFPNNLEELSLCKSFVSEYKKFFNSSSENMKKLRVLKLDHCQWVETDMILPLSKFPSLEILSLYMCKKVSDHHIAYLSLIGRFGFKNLKILDARFTGLGNECINSFYNLSMLQEIYFQSYCSTYREERAARKTEIEKTPSSDDVSYMSDDDDNDDTSFESIQRRFGGSNLSSYKIDALDDGGLASYRTASSLTRQEIPERPKSALYQYPYCDCTCGFGKNVLNNLPKNISQPLKRKIPGNQGKIHLLQIDPIAYNRFRKNEERKTPLPDYLLVESTPETKDRRWIGLRDPKNGYEISMLEHTSYHIDSFGMDSHFLDVNSVDLTDPNSVMCSLNVDNSRRSIHVIRNGTTLSVSIPHVKMFNVDPTDEVLSFSTEFLVNCARLIYLVHDECHVDKICPIIMGNIYAVYNKCSPDSDNMLLLREQVKELSKTVSCATRKMLRALVIGFEILKTVSNSFRNTICSLVHRATEKVVRDCQTIVLKRLREKCNVLRDNVPYEHGIYVNESPKDYCDTLWGFRVSGNDVLFIEEIRKCQCGQEGCPTCLEVDMVEVRDGRDEEVKQELSKSQMDMFKTASWKSGKDNTERFSPDNCYQLPTFDFGTNEPSEPPNDPNSGQSGSDESGNRRNPNRWFSRFDPDGEGSIRVSLRRNNEEDDVRNEEFLENEINNMFRRIGDVYNDAEPGPSRDNPRRDPEAPRRHVSASFRVLYNEIEIVRNHYKPKIPLKMLSLRGYSNVSDLSLTHLQFIDLDLLDVTKTDVSAKAVEKFLLMHPNCRVIHESACTCGPNLHF